MYLDYNEIGVEGARAIANALRINSVLKEIDLHGNRIGDEGARAIAKALEFNASLQNIDLFQNGIGSVTFEMFNLALKSCQNRRRQKYRFWVCSCMDHCRAAQSLGFDNQIFAFYIYPLLDITGTM
jgi:hypothetical protein